MSRAHRVNTMAGHLGAAVVAGYFISEQHPNLDDKVYAGIEGELDRIIRGESVFSPRQGSPITVTDMFAPHTEEPPKVERVENIAKALSRNIDEFHESGHNAIFASIAIRAFKDHPELATPAVIDGIYRLITDFNGSKPGSGYYGKQRGRIDGRAVRSPEDNTLPLYTDLSAMAEVVFEELILTAGELRVGFGGMWHVINHAAALAELAAYGYRELATKGLAAHHMHMTLFRTLPNVADERGNDTPTEYDPRTPEFWNAPQIRRDSARLTHRIKTLYGFYALVNLAADEDKLKKANEKLPYLT